jgi:hypothetical protein
MDDPLLAFAIKLPLALAVFVVIAYAGTASRRIAGVLFTFPILNGIAIIASEQPVVVADAIYPLVIFNCVLFAALISFPDLLPPVRQLPRPGRLLARITVWAAAWLAGAMVITHFRAEIFGGGILLIGAAVFALAFMRLFWSGSPDNASPRREHAAQFVAFWGTRTAAWRIVLFVITYGCLFWASRAAADQKWVGMASALPLPGLFALATLIDDAEAKHRDSNGIASAISPVRDTIFLGPVLVIPFNWVFAHLLASALPRDAFVARYLLLFAMWTVAALTVLLLGPRIAALFDRKSQTRR